MGIACRKACSSSTAGLFKRSPLLLQSVCPSLTTRRPVRHGSLNFLFQVAFLATINIQPASKKEPVIASPTLHIRPWPVLHSYLG